MKEKPLGCGEDRGLESPSAQPSSDGQFKELSLSNVAFVVSIGSPEGKRGTQAAGEGFCPLLSAQANDSLSVTNAPPL